MEFRGLGVLGFRSLQGLGVEAGGRRKIILEMPF